MSVTRNEKPRGRMHLGVCSNYLADLAPNSKAAVFVRESSFRPPWEMKNIKGTPPLVMVGPGTGFAPFRAFLQEAELLKQQDGKVGDLYVFFGCQKPDRDFIYKVLCVVLCIGVMSCCVTGLSTQTHPVVSFIPTGKL